MNVRQQQILQLLQQNGFVSVDYLCKKLYSSGATIRRDLALLETDQKLKRIHGGAIGLNGISSDSPYFFRNNSNVEEKKHIAALAKKLVRDSMTMFLDSSSSVTYLASELAAFHNLSIITNSVEIVYHLAAHTDAHVYASGGKIRNNVTMYGSAAQTMLRDRYADIFFFSCSGFSPVHGTTESNEDSVEIKQIMFQNSTKRVLLCDSSKIGKVFSYKCFSLSQLDIIITDQRPSDEFLKSCPDTVKIYY